LSFSLGDTFPKGIGILFDIDALGGGYYGYRAWQILMKHIAPRELCNCLLVDGDTTGTITRSRSEFCIGIYGDGPNFRAIRERFEGLDAPGLIEMPRRILEKVALDTQPLVEHGWVDFEGCLVTKNWDSSDLSLCKEFGWGYLPKDAPQFLREAIEEINRNIRLF
jgi:hypothetical protein